MCDWERVEVMLTGNEPMTDMKPGSQWLLPVTIDEIDGCAWARTSVTENAVICIQENDFPSLIPADMITELEAKLELSQAQNLENIHLAYQWMDRHDALATLCPEAILSDESLPPFPSPVPPDRITELEDEVAHWRRRYDEACAANSDMQKRNLEQMVKDQLK